MARFFDAISQTYIEHDFGRKKPEQKYDFAIGPIHWFSVDFGADQCITCLAKWDGNVLHIEFVPGPIKGAGEGDGKGAPVGLYKGGRVW